MELFKLEIHTTESNFKHFCALPDKGIELIGAIPLQYHVSLSDQNPPEPLQNVQNSYKVEIYTSTPPEEIERKFEELGQPITCRVLPCSPFHIKPSQGNSARMMEDQTLPDRTAPGLKDTERTHFEIVPLSDSTMRFKLETGKSLFFLDTIACVLERHRIKILHGRKLRQGDQDFATLTISFVPQSVISQIQYDLAAAIKGQNGSLHVAHSSQLRDLADNLQVTFLPAGSLVTMKISCNTDAAVYRACLTQQLAKYGVDVILARFTSKENCIDDVYHLKSLKNETLPADLSRDLFSL
jgi:hypothetical protein